MKTLIVASVLALGIVFAAGVSACPFCNPRVPIDITEKDAEKEAEKEAEKDAEKETEKKVETTAWSIWLQFNARIRWSEDNWQAVAADAIKTLEAIDGIEKAETGPLPANLVIHVTRDFLLDNKVIVVRPAERCGSPPTVDVIDPAVLQKLLHEALKPLFKNPNLPLAGVEATQVPKAPPPAPEREQD